MIKDSSYDENFPELTSNVTNKSVIQDSRSIKWGQNKFRNNSYEAEDLNIAKIIQKEPIKSSLKMEAKHGRKKVKDVYTEKINIAHTFQTMNSSHEHRMIVKSKDKNNGQHASFDINIGKSMFSTNYDERQIYFKKLDTEKREYERKIQIKKKQIGDDNYKMNHYEMIKGDLFSVENECSMGHCVSEDFEMGAGVALFFKKKYGSVAELLNQSLFLFI
jgi:hypothetical protein